jgi:hypothetical protein
MGIDCIHETAAGYTDVFLLFPGQLEACKYHRQGIANNCPFSLSVQVMMRVIFLCPFIQAGSYGRQAGDDGRLGPCFDPS